MFRIIHIPVIRLVKSEGLDLTMPYRRTKPGVQFSWVVFTMPVAMNYVRMLLCGTVYIVIISLVHVLRVGPGANKCDMIKQNQS